MISQIYIYNVYVVCGNIFLFLFYFKGGKGGDRGGREGCVCVWGVLSHSILRGATLFIGEVGGGGFPHGSC